MKVSNKPVAELKDSSHSSKFIVHFLCHYYTVKSLAVISDMLYIKLGLESKHLLCTMSIARFSKEILNLHLILTQITSISIHLFFVFSLLFFKKNLVDMKLLVVIRWKIEKMR